MINLKQLQSLNNENAQKIASLLVEVAQSIEECKNDACQIKNRDWFDRMISNNTQDLASIQIKQADILNHYFQITNFIIVMNMNNTFKLGQIQMEITKQEQARGLFNNSYLDFAKEMVSVSVKNATSSQEKMEIMEQELHQLKISFAASSSKIAQYQHDIPHINQSLELLKKENDRSKKCLLFYGVATLGIVLFFGIKLIA